MNETNARSEFQRLRALRESGLLKSHAALELDELCRQAKEHFQVTTALVTLIDKEVQI